jgi:transposase
MTHDLRALLRGTTGAKQSRVRSSSTAPRGNRPRRAGAEPAMTGTSASRAARCTSPSIRWGHLLALHVTPTTARDRAQVADVDRGYTGVAAREAAAEHGIDLVVVMLDEARRGFVLLPRRWVVERSSVWATQFRRLAKDYERVPATVDGLSCLAFATLRLQQLLVFAAQSP